MDVSVPKRVAAHEVVSHAGGYRRRLTRGRAWTTARMPSATSYSIATQALALRVEPVRDARDIPLRDRLMRRANDQDAPTARWALSLLPDRAIC